MANPSAPRPQPEPRPGDPRHHPSQPGQPGVVSDPDAPHPFGPDEPNPGERGGEKVGSWPPNAPPPSPPSRPLEDDEVAPDET